MPELPEVETVRRGLARGLSGRTIDAVEVAHPRAVRRHVPGAPDFRARLLGRTVLDVRRRGKFLWLPLDGGDALVGHLGMSGQLLVVPPDSAEPVHLRVRITFTDGGRELRFVDQRTFGGLLVTADGDPVPGVLGHIAPDPFDAHYDPSAVVAAMRRRRTGVKRALLDQALVSGVGNIYADEALWRARLHWARPTETLPRTTALGLLEAARTVMSEALAAGGTSFDALYVSAEGVSGLFERELAVYGRTGNPCPRCGEAIVRDAFANRSSFRCPRCQPRPRRARV